MALTKEKKMTKSYFDVLGICCTSEVPLIENILKSLKGVKEYSVIVPTRTVIVVHDSLIISQLDIVKALNKDRLEANVRVTGEKNFKNKWPSPFAVVSGVLLLLSLVQYVYSPFRWVAVAAVVGGIYPIFFKACKAILKFRFDINILVAITVVATLVMQDFTEAATVVFLFTIAEWLQTRASYQASAVMQSLMSLAPQKAVIAETREEVEVDELKINTVIAVKAGETIPIDGVVVDGNSDVDEKTLTGEASPVSKQKDSTVWAGTLNLNGYITVKTTALAEDCVVAKMAKLVEEAQNSKTKTQTFIDKCSNYYTPAIVVTALGVWVVPLALKAHNMRYWGHLALVVLVSACPCAIILSTPVATFCALTKAAKLGLLFKRADSLETLANVKTVAFDKTGTITSGEFVVGDFKSLSEDISLHNLLYWVSSTESKSSHPMAAALVDYAKSLSIEPKPEAVEDYQNYPGEGIYGKIDGKEVYIGNRRIASRAKCSSVLEVDTKGGKTVGYVYVGETLCGVFNLSDNCRSGAAQAMKELKSLKIRTAMLTGDNQAAAMHAQEQLGNVMDIVSAELLPEGKSKIIKEFKTKGPTAMVGDGLNDAPALATADIGISMGISGSALATQTGNIILMSNDIRKIPQAIKLARKAKEKVVQNVVLSMTIKAAIIGWGIAGHPWIWLAVLADVGTCLGVIVNSMSLLRDNSKDKGGDDAGDMEAGLLAKNSHKHWKLGCCGKKNHEKVVKPVAKQSGHCKSGCCGKKNQGAVMKPVAKPSSNHGHCKSGCCGKKNQENVVIPAKPSRQCKSGCCGKKNQEKVVEPAKPSGQCKLGCCGKKNQEKVMEPAAKHSSDHVHSGCCDKKHKDNEEEESVVRKSGCAEPGDMRKGHDSGCCGDKIQEPHQDQMKQSCDNKPGEWEEICLDDSGDGGFKSTGSIQRVNASMVKGCCSTPSDSLVASLKVKSGEHCESSSCCGSSEKDKVETCSEVETKEEACSHHHHHENNVELGLGEMKVKSDEHCESSCCESTKKDNVETCSQVKTKEEEACSHHHHHHENDVELGLGELKVKNDEHCESSCCGSTKKDKVETCSEVKTNEEACSHHHHHHENDDDTVGDLKEIVIE